AVHLLAEHPEVHAWLRADPAARSAALADEMLRLASPVQAVVRWRAAGSEGADGGGTVEAFLVSCGAANRDAAVFPDPDRLDPERAGRQRHLGFGQGPAGCLGAALAVVVVQVALEVLAHRTVALSGTVAVEYGTSDVRRGPERLDVELTREEETPG